MKDKIYVVLSEWETQSGNFDSNVIGIFYDIQQAVECLRAERDTILSETYNTTFDKHEGVDITEQGESHVFIFSKSCYRWDSLTIYEKEIEQRDFIAIQFKYSGEVFNERIYLDQIDLTHYDDIWDWWFGSNGNEHFPDLNFELTADKDKDGSPACGNMYINVYENEDAMVPLKRITDISWVHSWIERKEHHAKS